MDRLFVYGTLRRGSDNDQSRDLEHSARWVGHARIRGRLFRVAHYPAMIAPAFENEWVQGDLYEGVTAALMEKLDAYEGSEYVRELAEVTMDDGRAIASYLYVYTVNTDGLERITSGEWDAVTSPSSPLE